MAAIDEAIRLGEIGKVPVAPVITSRRDAFPDVVKTHEALLRRFDGFLLHPAVFDSGWIYTPSKPSLREPIKVIKDSEGYDELCDLGPIDFGLKAHKENDLIPDLERRLADMPNTVSAFVEEHQSWEVAHYCGAMGITPIGYITYYRGFNETMKDMAKDQQTVYSAAMTIAKEYPKFLSELAKSCKVPRVWVSFANATPAIVGEYYFEKIVWPTARTMLEDLIKEGVTPIVQFEENVKNPKFLLQLPQKSCMVHLSGEADLLSLAKFLSGHAAVAGNFKVPADDEEKKRITQVASALASDAPKNLILSTEGGSPFILTAHNAEKLLALEPLLA